MIGLLTGRVDFPANEKELGDRCGRYLDCIPGHYQSRRRISVLELHKEWRSSLAGYCRARCLGKKLGFSENCIKRHCLPAQSFLSGSSDEAGDDDCMTGIVTGFVAAPGKKTLRR